MENTLLEHAAKTIIGLFYYEVIGLFHNQWKQREGLLENWGPNMGTWINFHMELYMHISIVMKLISSRVVLKWPQCAVILLQLDCGIFEEFASETTNIWNHRKQQPNQHQS